MMFFARDWVECLAAVMLCASAAFTYLNGAYGTSVICAACAGLVSGLLFAKMVYRRRT